MFVVKKKGSYSSVREKLREEIREMNILSDFKSDSDLFIERVKKIMNN